MLNCREVTRLLSDSQERKLALGERLSLRMHLLMCAGCRNFGKQIDALRQIARAYVRGAGQGSDKRNE